MAQLTEEQFELIGNAVNGGIGIVSQLNPNKNLYPQCGKRPFFTGKRRDEYDACVASQPPAPYNSGAGVSPGTGGWRENAGNAQGSLMEWAKKNQTPLLIGGGLLLTALILKRR